MIVELMGAGPSRCPVVLCDIDASLLHVSHACRIKEIGFVVNRPPRNTGFFRAFSRIDSEQNHRTNYLICYLDLILEQRMDLLPVVCRLSALISMFGHEHSFSKERA